MNVILAREKLEQLIEEVKILDLALPDQNQKKLVGLHTENHKPQKREEKYTDIVNERNLCKPNPDVL
ncbi:hypothetical protein X798_07134 [Onchocerca flexuosa]|uniref:Uncharacterized protein n=1 Tax=Onchocerca flexuosa TaxID=387005 RepID=A0A238BKA5_9BILA|nr:hypothetical protein X798_07134 [Onchocerca flexuosa]